MTFKSTKVDVNDKSTGKVYGDLTIRGVTRPVVLDATFLGEDKHLESGLPTIGFEATTRVNREDFGLRWNVDLDSGGVLVGKQVRITLDVEAVAVPEKQPRQ
jgi:polyisoprenoid-binding protein YceI